MKANKSLEKIYLSPITLEELKNVITRPTDSRDIEYTRTDAFIEKALEWLEIHTFSELNLDFGHSLQIKEFVDRFKEYMKGE